MKFCPTCSAQLDDSVNFCPHCHHAFASQQPSPTPVQQPYTPPYTPPVTVDPYDHTAEFDAKDIADNKVVSMLVYLMGAVGIIIALLASKSSPYTAFHIRQALKLLVASTLATLALVAGTVVNVIPFLGQLAYIVIALAYVVTMAVLFVVKLLAFVQVCKNKAVEAPIVRNLAFLK